MDPIVPFYMEMLRQVSLGSAFLTAVAITGAAQFVGLDKTERPHAIWIGMSAFVLATLLTLIVAVVGMIVSITLAPLTDPLSPVQGQLGFAINTQILSRVVLSMALLLLLSFVSFVVGLVAFGWTHSHRLGLAFLIVVGLVLYCSASIFLLPWQIWRSS